MISDNANGQRLELPDGAVVRPATFDDIPALASLIADRMGPEDQVDLELVAETEEGLAGIGLVEWQGKTVATATLLDEELRVGAVTLPAGQIELVACATTHEHRGYVRALMDWCHQTSAARGHVVQVMIGIPNFYRQFGYEYAIPMHPWATLGPDVASPEGINVRSATLTDVPDLQRLEGTLQDSFDVAAPHQSNCWSWLIRGTSSDIWVAERSTSDGSRIEGVARVVGERDSELAVGEIAAESSDATRALLANARQLAGTSNQVRVADRPHVPDLSNLLSDPERIDWYYIRVPDPVVLLDALRPELLTQARSHGQERGELLLSFYRSHVRMTWDDAGMSLAREAAPLQAPVSAGGSGIPLQSLAALVLGCGAEGLESRFPDANLGSQADVMTKLFPPRKADLLTFYLPC